MMYDAGKVAASGRARTDVEIFTPQKIVNEMLDTLPERMFRPKRTFLEPSCGEGAFVVEILRRKFCQCKKRADYTAALKSVYAMDIQQDNVETCIANVKTLCRDFFTPTKAEMGIIEAHIIQADALKVMAMMGDEEISGEHTRPVSAADLPEGGRIAGEARLLTLDEVWALPDGIGVGVVREQRYPVGRWDGGAHMTWVGSGFVKEEYLDGNVYYNPETYGLSWRIWTDVPTEEQREAEEWR